MLALAACSEDAPPALPDSAPSDKVPVTTSSLAARVAFIQGRDQYEALHYAEAAMLFDQAIELDPDFALAHLMRATVTESAEQFYESLGKAEAVMVAASPGEQIIIQSFVAAAQNDIDGQYEKLKKLEVLYRHDERVHMRLGNFYMGQQRFVDAAHHFLDAIDINAQFAPAWNMLGYAHRGNGDYSAAKKAFRRYIDLVPDEPNPFDSYAELLMEAGDYDASIESYRRALSIAPDFPPSHIGLIINYSLKGEHENAIAAAENLFLKARNMPERQIALIRLSGAHLHAQDQDAALAALDRLASLALEQENLPVLAAARELAGDILLVVGETDAALGQYKAALEIRRESPISRSAKSQAGRQFLFKATLAALQSGRAGDAASYLAQYRAEARSGNAFEQRRIQELEGYSALLAEDYELAVEKLAAGNQMEPVVRYFSALACEGMGDYQRARDHAEAAAFRNTLAISLPYFRPQALEMLERLP
ncbi:MAG: tetratricopeptide repeat protein [Pseudomonadota bacterium]